MAKSNTELAAEIGNANKIQTLQIQSELETWKHKHMPKLVALAGDANEADKVFTICMNTIGRNPDLLECTFSSIANCILQSFQLKLFPGPFQQCAFVPLKNSKLNCKEANWWPQYQGLVELMLRARNKIVIARCVREGDYFNYREGSEMPLYAPAACVGNKRGRPLFTYAAVCSLDGLWRVEVIDEDQMEVLKNRSKSVQNAIKYNMSHPDTPWLSKFEDDVDAMRAKSAVKRVAKWCTKSADLMTAIELDNAVDGDANLVRASIIPPITAGLTAIDEPPNRPLIPTEPNATAEPMNSQSATTA